MRTRTGFHHKIRCAPSLKIMLSAPTSGTQAAAMAAKTAKPELFKIKNTNVQESERERERDRPNSQQDSSRDQYLLVENMTSFTDYLLLLNARLRVSAVLAQPSLMMPVLFFQTDVICSLCRILALYLIATLMLLSDTLLAFVNASIDALSHWYTYKPRTIVLFISILCRSVACGNGSLKLVPS